MAKLNENPDPVLQDLVKTLKHYIKMEQLADEYLLRPLKTFQQFKTMPVPRVGTFHYNSMYDRHMQHYLLQPQIKKDLQDRGVLSKLTLTEMEKRNKRFKFGNKKAKFHKLGIQASSYSHLHEKDMFLKTTIESLSQSLTCTLCSDSCKKIEVKEKKMLHPMMCTQEIGSELQSSKQSSSTALKVQATPKPKRKRVVAEKNQDICEESSTQTQPFPTSSIGTQTSDSEGEEIQTDISLAQAKSLHKTTKGIKSSAKESSRKTSLTLGLLKMSGWKRPGKMPKKSSLSTPALRIEKVKQDSTSSLSESRKNRRRSSGSLPLSSNSRDDMSTGKPIEDCYSAEFREDTREESDVESSLHGGESNVSSQSGRELTMTPHESTESAREPTSILTSTSEMTPTGSIMEKKNESDSRAQLLDTAQDPGELPSIITTSPSLKWRDPDLGASSDLQSTEQQPSEETQSSEKVEMSDEKGSFKASISNQEDEKNQCKSQ